MTIRRLSLLRRISGDAKMNDYRERPEQVSALMIKAGAILRYLIGDDDGLETIIICNPKKQRLITTDQELYHAIGSIKDYDDFKLKKLSKFFETVTVRTVAKKQLLTEEIVEKLRSEALKDEGD